MTLSVQTPTYILKVRKINGCSLVGIDTLPYPFDNGACGTYLFPEERVMLCFSGGHQQKCMHLPNYHESVVHREEHIPSVFVKLCMHCFSFQLI